MPSPAFLSPETIDASVHVWFDGDTARGYTPDLHLFSHWNTDNGDKDGLYLGQYRLGDLTWL